MINDESVSFYISVTACDLVTPYYLYLVFVMSFGLSLFLDLVLQAHISVAGYALTTFFFNIFTSDSFRSSIRLIVIRFRLPIKIPVCLFFSLSESGSNPFCQNSVHSG